MLKITEVTLQPFNQKPYESIMSGDFNLLNPIFFDHLKNLDRKKESYFYIYEFNNNKTYKFNLKNSEYESYKKLFNI